MTELCYTQLQLLQFLSPLLLDLLPPSLPPPSLFPLVLSPLLASPSQLVEHHVTTLDASALYDILVKMLRHVWGSNHTVLDHRDSSSNLCLLCHGMELWFGLATKLVAEYTRREKEDSAGEIMWQSHDNRVIY